MSYRLRLQLSNPGLQPRRIIIHAGTVFEVQDPFARVQNLVAAGHPPVTIPAGQSQAIEIETWCLNHRFRPPDNTPMRPTTLSTNTVHQGQQQLWADMDRRK